MYSLKNVLGRTCVSASLLATPMLKCKQNFTLCRTSRQQNVLRTLKLGGLRPVLFNKIRSYEPCCSKYDSDVSLKL